MNSIEGIVRYRLSDDGDDRCICCEGPHVYARSIEGVAGSGNGWIHDQLYNIPDGSRVRVTIEIVAS
jgi:hypothetical protein